MEKYWSKEVQQGHWIKNFHVVLKLFLLTSEGTCCVYIFQFAELYGKSWNFAENVQYVLICVILNVVSNTELCHLF